MNPMKKKTVRILFCVLLVAVLVSAFSMTAFAAGDVAGAIENTWKAASPMLSGTPCSVGYTKLFTGRLPTASK